MTLWLADQANRGREEARLLLDDGAYDGEKKRWRWVLWSSNEEREQARAHVGDDHDGSNTSVNIACTAAAAGIGSTVLARDVSGVHSVWRANMCTGTFIYMRNFVSRYEGKILSMTTVLAIKSSSLFIYLFNESRRHDSRAAQISQD